MAPAAPSISKDLVSDLKHVVVVLMENHAYDNLFGVYCTSSSSVCPNTTRGIPAGTCVPKDPNNLTVGCVAPYNFTLANLSTVDLLHSWDGSHDAYNHGNMDGWYKAERKHLETFGHYNATTVPVYYDIAQQFGLADTFYSSALSYSLPNHWYIVAGSQPAMLQKINLGASNISVHHQYLDQANLTPTIEQELHKRPTVSWTYYDYKLLPYGQAINDFRAISGRGAYNNWNPLAAKFQSYNFPAHFAPTPSFFRDVSRHQLPDISWVIPGSNSSDHPPANLSRGQDFVASVVNSIANSSYWKNTAIFIGWDDYGGFYDHVAPPTIDSSGLAFRVPMLVVSPWTPAGYVSHTPLDFESVLHLIEDRWGLGCLTIRDCFATEPTGFFNFDIHRAPVFFSPFANASYPYVPPPVHSPPFIESPSLTDSWIANQSVAD